jgi:threonine/homoserine/homoserine lactone efflux protein
VTAPLAALLIGLVLGFSLTIPPGPMNALIVARSIRSARAGTITGLGAMAADLVLGVLVFGVRSVVDLHEVVRPIDALGAVGMGYLGYRLIRSVRSSVPAEPDRITSFSQAFVVGVTNPLQILWWLTAGLAFAYLGGIVLFSGIFAAIAVWIVVFPLAVHAGTRRFPRAERWVTYGSGAVLFGFAAYFAILAL